MSERQTPIVPECFVINSQSGYWQLASLGRLELRYATATQVRGKVVEGEVSKRGANVGQHASLQQGEVYCLPTPDAWQRACAARQALQDALDALAAGLRELGSYASRLKEQGGFKAAPNPLTPTVIACPDPDDTSHAGWWFNPFTMPAIGREEIARHTVKMLSDSLEPGGYVFSQNNHFVCEDDGAWQRIEALHGAAEATHGAWESLLGELGTYHEAASDGRYAGSAGQAAAEPPPPPALSGGQRYAAREAHDRSATDLDNLLFARLEAAGWRWVGAKRASNGWHHLVNQRGALGTQRLLLRYRLEQLVADAAPAPIVAVEAAPPIPGALSEPLQDCARRALAADRAGGEALLAKAAAIADARRAAGHGEWAVFLEAIRLDERAARRLIAIHERADSDEQFAEAVRRGWLTFSVAAIAAQADESFLEKLLVQEQPPTVRAAQALAHPATLPDLEEAPPAPLVGELLKRISAHGWEITKRFTRGTGNWPYYEFHNFGADDDQDATLAEAELSGWLADLDRAAAYREAQRAAATATPAAPAPPDPSKLAAEACRMNIRQMQAYPDQMAAYRQYARQRAAEVADETLKAALMAEITATEHDALIQQRRALAPIERRYTYPPEQMETIYALCNDVGQAAYRDDVRAAWRAWLELGAQLHEQNVRALASLVCKNGQRAVAEAGALDEVIDLLAGRIGAARLALESKEVGE